MENPVKTHAARARTATLVVVGPSSRLAEAASLIVADDDPGAVRIVLISTETDGVPPIESQPDAVAISGLKPEYVNNAIAAVRLSSLPTVVWWRGGQPDALDGVAALADRVVLDDEDPWPLWGRAPSQFESTAMSDLRWARMTRWRAAMAHFFDLAEVRSAAPSLSHLSVTGKDRAQCALYAGWLDASLGWQRRVAVELGPGKHDAPMEAVVLEGGRTQLAVRLHPAEPCLCAEARVDNQLLASRMISLGTQGLKELLAEELRVRSRDLAFERALISTLSAEPAK